MVGDFWFTILVAHEVDINSTSSQLITASGGLINFTGLPPWPSHLMPDLCPEELEIWVCYLSSS